MTAHTIPRELIGLSRVAQIELEARQAETVERIEFIAVNDTHRIVEFDHALIWRRKSSTISTVSGGLIADKNAPQIVWFTGLARHLSHNPTVDGPHLIDPNLLPVKLQSEHARWLTGRALWIPLIGVRSQNEGGLIVLRSTKFTQSETRILGRIGNAFGHALSALAAPVKAQDEITVRVQRRKWAMAMVAVLLLLAVPVPMTVLGDARIVPAKPVLITAPLNAVIKTIHVAPNTDVKKGTPLFTFDKTELKSSVRISGKRVTVLKADRARAEQKGFNDPQSRAELSLISARLAQTYAELDRANEKLSRAEVVAPKPGVVLFDNIEGWEGRPVQVGEKVMVLANPDKSRLQIEIPIDDALVVEPGAEVRFFLAVRPRQPVTAHLSNVSYSPKILNNQKAVFIGDAEFEEGAEALRLGLTGTAKIVGPSEPLYYILLRKPLSALRRLLGI